MFGRKCTATPQEPISHLVVGLGNPGSQYDGTRHNAGFQAVDYIAQKCGVCCKKLQFQSLCARTVISGKGVLLMKPTTFMNLSGQAVTEAMRFYKIPPERTIILFDDISLPVGRMRVRAKGSDGGHNGIKNIIYLSGKDAFPRVKIGVGKKPHPDYDLAAWVLSRFSNEEQTLLEELKPHIYDAVQLMLEGRIGEAMNRHNGG